MARHRFLSPRQAMVVPVSKEFEDYACDVQKQLHAAGLAESPLGPSCECQEVEDAEHAFWRCPAWAASGRSGWEPRS